MQQYFSKLKNGNILKLDKEDENHIKNVMRFKPGEEIIVVHENIMYSYAFLIYPFESRHSDITGNAPWSLVAERMSAIEAIIKHSRALSVFPEFI